MHDVVDQLIRKHKQTASTNKNNGKHHQNTKRTMQTTTVPLQSSTPTTNKLSTPVQRSIRRYGKIKKSANSFSPVPQKLVRVNFDKGNNLARSHL